MTAMLGAVDDLDDDEGLVVAADARRWLESLVRADRALPADEQVAAVALAVRAHREWLASWDRAQLAGMLRLREAGLSFAEVAAVMGMRSRQSAEARLLALSAPPGYGEGDDVRSKVSRARAARREKVAGPVPRPEREAARRLVAAAVLLVDAREHLPLPGAEDPLDDLAMMVGDRRDLTPAGYACVDVYVRQVLAEARRVVAAGGAITSDAARRAVLAAERAVSAFDRVSRKGA